MKIWKKFLLYPIRLGTNILIDLFWYFKRKISKIFNHNSVLTLIQRDLWINKISVQEMKELTGYYEAASFDINTNTITIADNYIDVNVTESLFVHELIHFLITMD